MNNYIYISPDANTLFFEEQLNDQFLYKLFLLSKTKLNLSDSEFKDLCYELNIESYYENNNEKNIKITKPMKFFLENKLDTDLTKLIILIKRSKNLSLLKRIRHSKCIVLAKVEDNNIVIYQNENNEIIAFSSDVFLHTYLKDNTVLLQDNYKPLQISLMELDKYITNSEKVFFINPHCKKNNINFSLKITDKFLELLYEDKK